MRNHNTTRDRAKRQSRPGGRRVAAFAGLLAIAAVNLVAVPSGAVAVAADAPSGPAVTLYLPAPSGARPVGTTSLYLKDVSRRDPWVPSAKARELMVSLWYPAASAGKRRAQYMTPKESELLLTTSEVTGVPADVLSRTRTNAYTDVKPAGRKRGLPLVVLSPGFTWPRSSLTALAEEAREPRVSGGRYRPHLRELRDDLPRRPGGPVRRVRAT